MRKIISLLIVFALMISSITVLATPEEDFNSALFDNQIYSGNMKMEMSLNVDSELFNNQLLQLPKADIINQSKIILDAKLDIAKDYSTMKMDIKISFDIPNSEEFGIPAGSLDMEIWYDIDYPNNKMLIIIKNQDTKYMYADYLSDKMPVNMSSVSDMMKPEKMEELQKQLLSGIDKEAFKPVLKDGVYTVNLSADALKSISKSYLEVMKPIFEQSFASMPSEVDAQVAQQQLSDIFAKLGEIKLLADDAVVLECKLNDKKEMVEQNMKINFETNISDLITTFGGEVPLGITKENSDLKLTLNFNTIIENANEKIDIVYPELTAENSINMLDMIPVSDGINVVVNDEVVAFDVKPVMEDDRVLVPIRKFLNSIGVSDENIEYDDEFGIVTIIYEDNIVMLTIGDKTAYVNDEPVELDVPAKEIGGRTLLPIRFISETFGYDVSWMQNQNSNGGTVFLNKN